MIPGLVFAGLGLASYFAAGARQRKFERTLETPDLAEGHQHTAYNRRQERYSIVIIVMGLAASVYGLAGGFDP